MIEVEISHLSAKEFISAVTNCNKNRECNLKIISQTVKERTIIFKVESKVALDFFKLGKEFVFKIDGI